MTDPAANPVSPTPAPVPEPQPETNSGQHGQGNSDPTWLPERLERARRAEREALLKELGVEKPEDAKTALAEFQKLKDAQLSEADRAKQELERERQKREKAESDLVAERQTRLIEKRDSEIRNALRDARAKNVDKTFAVIATLKKADVEAVLKDDGTVDAAKVKAIVEVARKDYAEDFGGSGPGSPSLNGGRTPNPGAANEARARRISMQRIKG